MDETTQAKKSYVRLNISTGTPVAGIVSNPKKIKLQGCTTLAQAENRAQLEARRLIYQRISVSDTALADAGGLGIGALVRWIDPNDFAGTLTFSSDRPEGAADLLVTRADMVPDVGRDDGDGAVLVHDEREAVGKRVDGDGDADLGLGLNRREREGDEGGEESQCFHGDEGRRTKDGR